MARRGLLHLHHTDANHRVTSLELFFDLVFVLALTQVTTYLAAHLTAEGAVRGLLVLAVMWWSWGGFTWLTNYVRADHGAVRPILVVVMAAALVMTLAIPEVFDDGDGEPPSGPLVFAGAYVVLRLMHLTLFALAGREDPQLLGTLARFSIPSVIGTGFLVVAAFSDGRWQTLWWLLAVVGDLGGTLIVNAGGWRLPAPGHFAERHGLVVILALGESLVAVGVGTEGLSLSWAAMLAAVLALSLVACLWWIYFDVVAGVAERRLASLEGAARAALGRDSYSYLHFPMVAGIIFVALGLKKTLGAVADSEHYGPSEPLHGLPLIGLYGGVALYLLAHVAFRWRNLGSTNWRRLGVAAVLLAAIPLVSHLPALVQLGLVVVALMALCSYESLRFRTWRHELQHAERHEAHA
ncbi:MAG: low temperature requirement protein A [Kineosporiaceae bacterium]